MSEPAAWHGTTILSVRKGRQAVVAGDGQVSLGNTVIKANAKKIRRLGGGSILAGFAGSTADAFTLLERLEGKLERHPGQLMRACVEPADGLVGIGSGGQFALAAARALLDVEGMGAEAIARKAMAVAAEICVFTN